jgi:hypothetical protein
VVSVRMDSYQELELQGLGSIAAVDWGLKSTLGRARASRWGLVILARSRQYSGTIRTLKGQRDCAGKAGG